MIILSHKISECPKLLLSTELLTVNCAFDFRQVAQNDEITVTAASASTVFSCFSSALFCWLWYARNSLMEMCHLNAGMKWFWWSEVKSQIPRGVQWKSITSHSVNNDYKPQMKYFLIVADEDEKLCWSVFKWIYWTPITAMNVVIVGSGWKRGR